MVNHVSKLTCLERAVIALEKLVGSPSQLVDLKSLHKAWFDVD